MRIRDTAHESYKKSKDTAAPVSVRVEFFDNLIGYFKTLPRYLKALNSSTVNSISLRISLSRPFPIDITLRFTAKK